MYVNLISAALQSYFDPHELSGQLLISAIAIAAAFIITLTLIYLLKRKWFVKVLAAALACFLVFSVVVIALSLSQDLKENAEDFQKYQTVFAIGTFSALAAGFALVVILKRAAGKYYKPVAISAAVVMAALTIAFFVISFINNASPLAESYALTQKSQLYLAITLFTAVLFGILIVSLTNTKTTTFEIVFAAVSIAMSFALSYIRIFKLPQGGSVTFASLVPIVIYSYKFGIRKGVLCCFIYGLLQSFQDPWIVHPLQYFLDYPLAFGAIGLSGFLRGKMKDSAAAGLGFFSALIVRYLCHAASGALFFGTYGAEFGVGAVAWGFLYNAFVFADGAIALVAIILLMNNREVLRFISRGEEKPQETAIE